MSGLGRSNLIDASPSFSDSQEDSDEGQSWIEWWTHLKGNEFLCEVSEEFLRDDSNLYGFPSKVILLKFSLLAVDVSNMFFGAIITLSSFGFHAPPQIPFYPYAINIILDDDPDINDQELDGQQQVHSGYGFAILLFPVVLSLSVFSPLGLGFGGERCRDFVRPRSFSFYNYKQGS